MAYPDDLSNLPANRTDWTGAPADAPATARVTAAAANAVETAINQIEDTLGLTPQGPAASVAARLTALDSTVAGKLATSGTAADAAAVGGVTVTGTPTTGQVLKATSPTAATWQADATGGGGGAVTSVVGATGDVAGSQIVADAAVAAALAAKLGTGAGAVGTSNLADGSVTAAKVAADVATQSELDAVAAAKADTVHVHSAVDVTSGTLPLARGGTGGTDAAGARSNLGLGTAATQPATAFAPAAAVTGALGVPSTTTTGTLVAGQMALVDATSAAIARTLPAADSVPAGTVTGIKKIDGSANAVTVSRAGADTITGTAVGQTSRVLTLAGESIELTSDGTSVWVITSTDTPSPSLASTYARRLRDVRPANPDAAMVSPPTVGAITTTSAAALTWAATAQVATFALGAHFSFPGCGDIVALGTSSPDNTYVKARHITDPVGVFAPMNIEFTFDGTYIELRGKGSGGRVRVRVNGELVSLTPVIFTNDGSTYLLPLTFATRAARRITVEADSSFAFSGVRTGATDSVIPTQVRGPRVIVMGDSFTDGTGAAGLAGTSWVTRFAQTMGWSDTWKSGVGGTGYLNTGAAGRTTFRGRVTADVIAHAPDVVIVAGGINDTSSSQAAIQTEAALLFEQIRAGLPNATLVVLSPYWRNGVETFTSALLGVRDGIKAAAIAAGAIYLDVLELPLPQSVSTTLAADAASGATTVSLIDPVPIRSTITIGQPHERRIVTALSGTGPYTATVAALAAAHSSGEAVATVGPSLWTGTGKVGTATGAGNSDLLVTNDGTHPTQAGHDLIGSVVARLLDAALGAF